MSKKYKNKNCVYCAAARPSEGADHVLARAFFNDDDRGGIPKVPSCRTCNNKKSNLEAYLATILPFGANHEDSKAIFENFVQPRLNSNQRLRNEISAGSQKKALNRNGLSKEEFLVPFESEKILELFAYVVKGLHFHHWGHVVPQECSVEASFVNAEHEILLDELFQKDGQHVNGCFGRNVLVYDGIRDKHEERVSFWRFKVYGGLDLLDDLDPLSRVSQQIYAACTKSPLRSVFGD